MAEKSYTPGPWTAKSDGTHHYHIASKPYAVGTLQAFDHPGINGPANARLIAAAPELLEAAKKALAEAESWIHDQLDGTSSLEGALAELEPVRAAIAKATGGAQ